MRPESPPDPSFKCLFGQIRTKRQLLTPLQQEQGAGIGRVLQAILRRAILVFGLIWLCCATGCGTIISLRYEPRPYGGMQFDFGEALTKDPPLGFLFVLFDLPFSFLFDTLLLPATIRTATEAANRGSTYVDIFGIVSEGDKPGYLEVPDTPEDWPPKNVQPIGGAHFAVFVEVNGTLENLKLEAGDSYVRTATSQRDGQFSLYTDRKGDADIPWQRIVVERDGFQPVEIPGSTLHRAQDTEYWRHHHLLIRMARR